MIVGYTGSREGMSKAQKEWVRNFMLSVYNELYEVHHGDCVGGDNEFDDIVRDIAPADCKIIVHPSNIEEMRSYVDCKQSKAGKPKIETIMLDERPAILRDCDIVESVDVIIATPRTDEPTRHSGTWFTYRYANKKNVKTYLVYPDGTTGELKHE